MRTETGESARRTYPIEAIIPNTADRTGGSPADLRFRALLPEQDWIRLPEAIRRRFTKRLGVGQTAVYTGRIAEVAMSRAGFLLAQAARLIGAPLPLSRDVGAASVVTVTEDQRFGGQVWTRLYARHGRLPQIIHSRKRFGGETGLEEHVGGGIGMSLTLSASDTALTFTSRHYFLAVGRRRFRFPRWLAPGVMTLAHTGIDATHFAFTLDLHHPWLGSLIHQRVVFEESPNDLRPTLDADPAADGDGRLRHALPSRVHRAAGLAALAASRAAAACGAGTASMPCCFSCSAGSRRMVCGRGW